jgi:Zn-dependent M28 family amino/carboxypeptidase
VVLIGEHYNLIARLVEQGVPVELEVNVQGTFHTEDTNGYNVIAEIPGVDSEIGDEVVLVGAHMDSWHSATGATDNADGSAVVMEAMRILKALGVEPRRTIRAALWSGEEQGLHGSRHYVEDHLGDDNPEARDNFSVYFNLDPGYGAIYGWFLEGNQAMYPIMQAWSEPFRDLGATTLTMRGIGSTDHLNFIRAGLPGFQAIHSYVDYDVRTHHTNMDTYERIEEGDLEQASVVMASILYHAAMRDEKMPRATGGR